MEILTLGQKIKRRRKELGMTLKDLAGERVTPAQISYVETDKCKPSLDLLQYISNKLGLEVEYLVESEKKQVIRYCDSVIKIYRVGVETGDLDGVVKELNNVLELSEAYDLIYYAGEAQCCLADAYLRKGSYKEAFRLYIKALHEFLRVDDIRKISETYLNLGLVSYHKGYLKSSLMYLKVGRDFAERLDDTGLFIKSKIYYYLAMAYNDASDNEMAVHFADKASFGFDSMNNPKGYYDMVYRIIKQLQSTGNLMRAAECAEKCYMELGSICDMAFIAQAETNMAKIYNDGNLTQKAFEHIRKAINIKQALGDDSIPLTLLVASQIHIRNGELDMGLDRANEALDMAIKQGNSEYELRAYKQLFSVYREKGDFIKAEESIRRCINIAESAGICDDIGNLYMEIGQFYRKISRINEAVFYLSKAVCKYREPEFLKA